MTVKLNFIMVNGLFSFLMLKFEDFFDGMGELLGRQHITPQ